MPDRLNMTQALLLAHVSRRTMYYWIAQGKIQADQTRRPWRIDKASLERFIKQRLGFRS